MYPSDELALLHARKQVILARSALLRAECVIAACETARPFHLLETAAGWAKRLSPLLALAPLFFRKKKEEKKSPGFLGMALKYAPVVLRAIKLFRSSPTPSSSPRSSPVSP